MGRWDRHLWRLTQFQHRNWRALSAADVGSQLPVLFLWFILPVMSDKAKSNRFLFHSYIISLSNCLQATSLLVSLGKCQPWKQMLSPPSTFGEMDSYLNNQASWKKCSWWFFLPCDAEWWLWAWCRAALCEEKVSPLWADLMQGWVWLELLRELCENTYGLVYCNPESDNPIASQISSMLNNCIALTIPENFFFFWIILKYSWTCTASAVELHIRISLLLTAACEPQTLLVQGT